jgi:hypothetical protein
MTRHLFEKGNTYSANGNGSGRPLGSRTRLCKRLLEDLAADWAEGGIAAIRMMRMENPSGYCKMMASILPKELLFESGAVTELDDNALERIDQFLVGLHQQIIEGKEVQMLLVPPGAKN